MSQNNSVHPCGLSDYFIETLDKLRIFTCVINLSGKLIYLSKAAKDILRDDNCSNIQPDFFKLSWVYDNKEFSAFVQDNYEKLEFGHSVDNKEIQVRHLGVSYWFDVSVDYIGCSGCNEKLVLVQGLDVTKQHSAESQNSLINQRLNLHRNQSQIAMIEWDKDLKVIDWNSAAEEIFGIKKQDALDKSLSDFYYHESDREETIQSLQKSFQDCSISHCIVDNITSTDQVKTCDWYNTKLLDEGANTIGYTSMVLDVTVDLKMLHQVQQSERLNALNSVIGGIVHDFNNILMVILGYTDLIKTLSEKPRVNKYASGAYSATEKGMRLATKLTSYLKRHSDNSIDMVASEVLNNSLDILRRAVGSGVNLSLSKHEKEWTVHCDKDDFEDAILNMCINSAYAMDKSGEIKIRVSNVSLIASEAKMLDLDASDYVLVKVADNGSGMDSETVKKVLDPYFTTKGDQGTGLGLCQVYGFVKRCGGAIEIRSFPDKGTSIYLYFPKAGAKTASQDIFVEDKQSADTSTILVVDDDKDLGFLYSEVLKKHGYDAIALSSSTEAMMFLDNNNVDVLISDIVMPDVDGYELAHWVLDNHPTVKVQLMSGFNKSEYIRGSDNSLDLTKNLLDKPISTYTLVERVWELVDVIYCNNLSTGILEMDEDHQALIHMINSLSHLKEASDFGAINEILDNLQIYCEFHLGREEALMDQFCYPNREEHKRTHEVFTKAIKQFNVDIVDENKDPKVLVKYLITWLSKHIVSEDKKLAEYITSQKEKDSELN